MSAPCHSSPGDALRHAHDLAYLHNSDLSPELQGRIYEEAVTETRSRPACQPRRTVLLVGGAGYIGAVVTPFLLARGYGVRCLDLLLYGNEHVPLPFLGHSCYQFLHGDFARQQDMEKALEGVRDVVILGGLVGDPITRKYPDAHEAINAQGIQRLITTLDGRKLNKVIFVSTCSNYGLIPENAVADEHYALAPLSLYAKAKVAAEETLLTQKDKVDYQATVLRFATAFGLSSRMRFDLTVSEFTRELFWGRELVVFDADTWRPYCHVQDFARAIARVLEAPQEDIFFEVFNAGGDENNATKRHLVDLLLKRLPQGRVVFQKEGPDPRNYRVDFGKIRQALDFRPVFTIENGMDELLGALGQGLLQTPGAHPSYYGNYELAYG